MDGLRRLRAWRSAIKRVGASGVLVLPCSATRQRPSAVLGPRSKDAMATSPRSDCRIWGFQPVTLLTVVLGENVACPHS